MASFEGKVIIITGAASGIGAACARILAPFKASIVLVSNDSSGLQKVFQECICIGLLPENSLLVCCDTSKENDRKSIVEKAVDKFQRIDVLINNTSVALPGALLDTSLSTFDEAIKHNLKAPFHMIQLCVPHLSKVQGAVVNVSSTYGQRVCNNSITYALSMAAFDHLTRNAAKELAKEKVRVNSVSPGYTESDLQIETDVLEITADEILRREEENQPLTSVINVRDVAKVIKFLASEDSKTITGEILVVDGGRNGVKRK